METQLLSDIKVRYKNDLGDLEWVSIKNLKVMADGSWSTILPGKYRISYNGYWYELAPINLNLDLLWGVSPNLENPTAFSIISKMPSNRPAVEYITAKLTNTDHIGAYPAEFNINSGLLANNTLLTSKNSSTSIEVNYVINSSKPLSESTLANYIVNTNKMVLPNLKTSTKLVLFSSKGGEDIIGITPYLGDIEYAEGNTATTADWSFVMTNNSWVTATKVDNSIKVLCLENVEGDRTVEILVTYSLYPFLTKTILIKLSANPIENISNDSKWLILLFNWVAGLGSDLDNRVLFTGINNLELNDSYLGYENSYVPNVDIYKKKSNNEYELLWPANIAINTGVVGSYIKNDDGTYTIISNESSNSIPVPTGTPIITWGGTVPVKPNIPLIAGESYLINVSELKKYRDLITSNFNIKCNSLLYTGGGLDKYVVFHINSYKLGYPKIVNRAYKIYTDLTYTLEMEPDSSVDFPSTLISNTSLYTRIANIEYAKGIDLELDYLRIEGRNE